MMRSFVTVTYIFEGVRLTEDYGPFDEAEHLVWWLGQMDPHRRNGGKWGPHAVIEVKYLGAVGEPPPPAAKAPRKRAVKR